MQTLLFPNQVSENIFKKFYKNSRDFLFIVDVEGIITEINHAALSLGFNSDEIIGKDFSMFFSDEFKPHAQNFLSNAKNETASTFSIPLKSKNSDLIPVELSIIRGKWDKEEANIIVCRDISRVKFSEEKFYKVFNANQILMAISTIDTGIFINVNQKFLKILGYREDEIIGHSSYDLKLFYDYSQRQEVIKQLGTFGKIEDYEVKILKKSGEMIYCNFSIEQIKIQNHDFLLTSAIDISKQKEAEQQLQQLKSEKK